MMAEIGYFILGFIVFFTLGLYFIQNDDFDIDDFNVLDNEEEDE
jgi:hypothetical protein